MVSALAIRSIGKCTGNRGSSVMWSTPAPLLKMIRKFG